MCQIKSTQGPCHHQAVREEILFLLGYQEEDLDSISLFRYSMPELEKSLQRCPFNCANICELDTILPGRSPEMITVEEIFSQLSKKSFLIRSVEELTELLERDRIRFPVRVDPVFVSARDFGEMRRGPFFSNNTLLFATEIALTTSLFSKVIISEIRKISDADE
ncbi:MAG: hypothetical protein IPN70_04575 [Candidatus Moraniibacteriota bacterium]|nr:MAG: hypothetical protein IPN70_04575 [Candidatus Moranbacteria bacterium]